MDKAKKFKIGKILSITGALVFGIFGFLLIITLIGDTQAHLTLLYVGIAGTVCALAFLASGFILMYVDGKKGNNKCVEYAAYPAIDIKDYKTELDSVRANFAADNDPDKNKIAKVEYFGCKEAYNFNTIKDGKIYYAYIVEANDKLFKNNKIVALPAVVVYSPDEYFEEHPLVLKYIAERLYAEKNINVLKNEGEYFYNLKLPTDQTDGRLVYMTSLMVYRYHLPLRYLSDSLLPVIASPETSKSVFVVDVKYWTKNLIGAFVHSASHRDKIFVDV